MTKASGFCNRLPSRDVYTPHSRGVDGVVEALEFLARVASAETSMMLLPISSRPLRTVSFISSSSISSRMGSSRRPICGRDTRTCSRPPKHGRSCTSSACSSATLPSFQEPVNISTSFSGMLSKSMKMRSELWAMTSVATSVAAHLGAVGAGLDHVEFPLAQAVACDDLAFAFHDQLLTAHVLATILLGRNGASVGSSQSSLLAI